MRRPRTRRRHELSCVEGRLDGLDRARDRFDAAVTRAGIAVLTGGLLVWGVGYHAALAAARRPSSLLTGALSGLGGDLVDRLILPDRVMASFRKTMGVLGTAAKYVALGVVSARAAR